MTFTTGNSYSCFTLKKKQRIDEIDSDVYLFEHDLLGCSLFAIKNKDINKTFSVAFNTIPTDSTGVAHILEHSVLMGSKKYPVNDVFGEINKGGLMTFLNAMTGSDLTYYPFATRNKKEYFNIMDVYCDVVFNPLLDRATFEQEGYHYHRENEQDPVHFQGVVYNEMKGAFSDPTRLIFHHIFSGLMPGSTYAHESGGDPKNIPDLSYEQFVDFHHHHYHPSNGTFFLYGDADLAEELAYLQSNFLNRFSEKEQACSPALGEPISEIQHITDTYSVNSGDTAEKTFLAVGTEVCTVMERQLNTSFQIIAGILFNSDASPLKNGIITSGLCKDFGGFYVSSSCPKTFMTCYLIGSEAEKKDAFLELYTSILTDMVNRGIDRHLLLSELNKFEFNAREEASKAQRGLNLIGKSMTALKYGADPFHSLVYEQLFHTVREKALHERYFEELIKKYLLANPATVVVTLSPDPEKAGRDRTAEQQRIDTHLDTLEAGAEEKLTRRTEELMAMQMQANSPEKLAKLPRLSLDDLSSSIDFHETVPTEMFGRQVLVNELATNHISYIDIGFHFDSLPSHLLPYLDLFGSIITEIGTKKMDYVHFAKEIATCTGGFSHSVTTYTPLTQKDPVKPIFWLHVKCLPEYLERTIRIMAEIFSELSLEDRSRIQEIVGREYAWAEHSIQSEGYMLPATRIFSHLSTAGRYNEMIHGVTSYQALKELSSNYQQMEDTFLAGLQEIATLLFNRHNLHLSITADTQEVSHFSQLGTAIVDSLHSAPVIKQELQVHDHVDHEAFITSAEVVFAAQGGNLLKNGDGYNGHFEVLKTYLNRDYLWNSVRQMGGAYGCFLQFSQFTGNLALISYRDPQVRKTYSAYENIPTIIGNLDLHEKALEQLIIGTYGGFDPHQSQAAVGATARNEYFVGITPSYKQQRLREITATTIADLRMFAQPFAQLFQNSHRAIIGNRAKIEKDNDLFDTITEL